MELAGFSERLMGLAVRLHGIYTLNNFNNITSVVYHRVLVLHNSLEGAKKFHFSN